MLAHHIARAEDWPRAATYFEKAAEQAAATFAIQEALALCDRAIEALEHSGESFDHREGTGNLRARKAALLMLVSDFERAHAEHQKAVTIVQQLGNRAREGAAIAAMALASLRAHDFERSFENADAPSRSDTRSVPQKRSSRRNIQRVWCVR